MISREKVMLVGVETEENYRQFDSSMQELVQLAKTANGEIIGTITQKRATVDHQSLIGKGKLQELHQWVDAEEIDVVIFNQELSPRQQQIISQELGVLVLDRVQLILDIFALRARSKEGKLQVELAQLNYLLPRLVGQGTSMSRLGAGIGTRGPGETKLETDRRHIRDRIAKIKRELKQVAAHRERTRSRRKQQATVQIGLIGYTNAGKSTVLNRLTAADTYEQDQLFATLDPLTKKWRLPEGLTVTLTDTVGFIQELPTQLVDAFHSTLEESKNMDILLHVVDASSPDRTQHEATVLQLMKELELENIPTLTIYNKADKLEDDQFVPTLFPNVVVSAKNFQGKEVLSQAVKRFLMTIWEPYECWLPAEQAGQLSDLERQTLVIAKDFDETRNSYHLRGFQEKPSDKE